jgi:hypothetical protein
MSTRSSTSSSDHADFETHGRVALRAMLIAVALCVVTDVAFRFLLPPSVQNTYYRTARAEIAHSDAPDIQIVGDSAVHQGLIASAVAPNDSMYARNDGLSGTRVSFTYYLLRRQFEQNRIPRAIVIAHTPSFSDPQIGKLTSAFLNWEELPEVYSATSHWMDALYGVIARTSYILTNRDYFRDFLMQGNYGFFIAGQGAGVYQRITDTELLDAYRSGTTDDLAPDRFEERRRIRPFYVDEEADLYFRRLLALAKEHDVKVYWLTMPVPEIVAELQQRFDIERSMLDYLQQFEESGDLAILQGPFIVYDDELFQDIIHATPAAAVKFSCYVRTLVPTLADLPRAGPAPVDTAERNAVLSEQRISRQVLADTCAAESAVSSLSREESY